MSHQHKQTSKLGVAILLTALSAGAHPAFADTQKDYTAKSEALIAKFAKRLREELTYTMNKSGPVAAIEVCKTKAPLISSELSRESGAAITRVSEKFRNPLNMPNDWQQQALKQFAKQLATNPKGLPVYYKESGTGQVRYMEAIKAGGLCLTCHGTDIDPKLQQVLNKDYPYDMAQGYKAGDLRGAFSVVWQLNMPKDLEAINVQAPAPNLLTAGQPSQADIARLKAEGVTTVINLRTDMEMSFDEAAAVKAQGMNYIHIPIAGAAGITAENAQLLRSALNKSQGKVFVHCASSNRVGALMALNAYRDGKSAHEAIALGQAAGLKSLESQVTNTLKDVM